MTEAMYFQWQNDALLQTIYPLREMKLRDFLIYYQEIDLWAEYKDKDIASLQAEYVAAQEKATAEAYDNYQTRKAYFLKSDVRAAYANFAPLDESELARINELHGTFASSFKYDDVRKEKNFVADRIYEWDWHRSEAHRLVTNKQRRISIMKEQVPPNPNIPKELVELAGLQAALAMAEEELSRLNSFLASFEKIEKRKLELLKQKQDAQRSKDQLGFQLTDLNDRMAQALRKAPDVTGLQRLKDDIAQREGQIRGFDAILNTSEEAYVTRFIPDGPIRPEDISHWKMEEYKAGLLEKDHRQLLEEVVQRFVSQPTRYPLWLQYMIIHFSGMRYASAHGSWADPKALLVSLRAADIARDLKQLDEGTIDSLCEKTLAAYTQTGNASTLPKLATATEPDWRDKVAFHLRGLRSLSPTTRFNALLNLRMDEESYEVDSLAPAEALEALKGFRDRLPEWMWKEIVEVTQLRVTEVKDTNWEKLTPEEEQASFERESAGLRQVLAQWKMADITGWREEHDRTSQLIVSRAVCNEVAEHIQHLRGHSPDGGLTPKAPWYQKQEAENTLPGTPRPYFRKPVTKDDYTVGASILWLRFWEKEPNPWQEARQLTTKMGGYGLLPPEFLARKSGLEAAAGWNYQLGTPTTRTRRTQGDKNTRGTDLQYLRWVHEATVAEVAETADGTVVLTFETALPYEDPRLSSVGMFKHTLGEMLSEGDEDTYNRSFVGFVPEGQVPLAELQGMLDWNKILRRPFVNA
ncbi:MAG: hypothetical protein ACM3QS_17785 [Bacteroidota bacterium]